MAVGAYCVARAFRGSGRWTEKDIPSLAGQRWLITGGNTGLGLATAKHLAAKGAHVVITTRSHAKADAAIKEIASFGSASSELMDLCDLNSVTACAERLVKESKQFDGVILNAGVMIPPYSTTEQGFEMQVGVNHLGHFAFTVKTLQAVKDGARIVVVSSSAQDVATKPLPMDSMFKLKAEKYNKWNCYGNSKLCNLLFAAGLRSRLKNRRITVTTSHPGYTATELQRHSWIINLMNNVFAMSPAQGALTQVRAAVDPHRPEMDDAQAWYAPSGLLQMHGNPELIRSLPAYVGDQKAVDALWAISEELTGTRV
eukprot:TRINITY_DN76897_c0_g1_i1.p1 TRINITY_DN76897_c0_g1~~TRINITY_DN76897_c0_g1_i1.p1  ORF type:complete len:347 (+),score=40.42 TRINITY_DN76897_c0_g1_i1:103-1041(+)